MCGADLTGDVHGLSCGVRPSGPDAGVQVLLRRFLGHRLGRLLDRGWGFCRRRAGLAFDGLAAGVVAVLDDHVGAVALDLLVDVGRTGLELGFGAT